MNNRNRAGVIAAIIGIIVFMAMFNSGSPTPIVNWPVETYMGMAFTIGWLSSYSYHWSIAGFYYIYMY